MMEIQSLYYVSVRLGRIQEVHIPACHTEACLTSLILKTHVRMKVFHSLIVCITNYIEFYREAFIPLYPCDKSDHLFLLTLSLLTANAILVTLLQTALRRDAEGAMTLLQIYLFYSLLATMLTDI